MKTPQNFWLIIPILIIIPVIVVSLITDEIEQESLHDLANQRHMALDQLLLNEIAENIEGNLELIIAKLEIAATQEHLQSDFMSSETQEILQQTFSEINEISPISDLVLIDKDFVIVRGINYTSVEIEGVRADTIPFAVEASETMEPTLSGIYRNVKGLMTISILYPIPDKETGEFEGILSVVLSSSTLVGQHGNIKTDEKQFLAALDKNFDFIVSPKLIGKNYYSTTVQDFINHNEIQNAHVASVFAGNQSAVIFDNGLGEQIDSGRPIWINDKIEYFLFLVTPTLEAKNIIEEITRVSQIRTTILMLIIAFFVAMFALKQRKTTKKDKLATIGHLSSNIAHDIRNPLGAIKSSSVIIDKENKDQNKIISRELERQKISIRRISHQVEEVLNYVRTTPLRLKINSLSKVLEESVQSIEIPKHITIILPQKDIKFQFDREKLLIVFVNILLNAVHAIGEKKGQITIKLEESKSDVILHFKNNGPAIPDSELSKIFEPLFTTHLKGTGLGLSSCKNIIEQHQGKISAIGDPVTFTIKISKSLE